MRIGKQLAYFLLATCLWPPISYAGEPQTQVIAARKGSSNVVVTLYIDRKENNAFIAAQEDSGFKGFVYDIAGKLKDRVDVQPDSKEIMGVWKGNETIRLEALGLGRTLLFFDEPIQFAPVLLVVDATNAGRRSTQITGAYLEVTQSQTDLQPYLTAFGSAEAGCIGEEATFEANVGFRNWGWGQAENATVRFSFADASNQTSDDTYVQDIGDIDVEDLEDIGHVQEFSILDHLRRSGVDVDRLKLARFECPSIDAVSTCIKALADEGLFGKLSNYLFSEGAYVSVRTLGSLEYTWRDSRGLTHQRHSPFSVDVVILEFNRVEPECGAGGAVERNYKTLKLSLDRKRYRIPLPYKGKLAAHQNRRFALALVAVKSSQHVFKVVIELADGTTASSPEIDLLYFMPRFPYTQ